MGNLCFLEQFHLIGRGVSRQNAESWSYLEVYLILAIKFHPWGDLKRTGKGMCCVLRRPTKGKLDDLIGVFQLSSPHILRSQSEIWMLLCH